MKILQYIRCLSMAIPFISCTDNTPVCVPKTPTTCFCATGSPGQKICDPDGLGYGDCICVPDAGIVDAVNTNDTPVSQSAP